MANPEKEPLFTSSDRDASQDTVKVESVSKSSLFGKAANAIKSLFGGDDKKFDISSSDIEMTDMSGKKSAASTKQTVDDQTQSTEASPVISEEAKNAQFAKPLPNIPSKSSSSAIEEKDTQSVTSDVDKAEEVGNPFAAQSVDNQAPSFQPTDEQEIIAEVEQKRAEELKQEGANLKTPDQKYLDELDKKLDQQKGDQGKADSKFDLFDQFVDERAAKQEQKEENAVPEQAVSGQGVKEQKTEEPSIPSQAVSGQDNTEKTAAQQQSGGQKPGFISNYISSFMDKNHKGMGAGAAAGFIVGLISPIPGGAFIGAAIGAVIGEAAQRGGEALGIFKDSSKQSGSPSQQETKNFGNEMARSQQVDGPGHGQGQSQGAGQPSKDAGKYSPPMVQPGQVVEGPQLPSAESINQSVKNMTGKDITDHNKTTITEKLDGMDAAQKAEFANQVIEAVGKLPKEGIGEPVKSGQNPSPDAGKGTPPAKSNDNGIV